MVDEPVKGSTGNDKNGSDRSHSGLDKPKFPDFSKLTKAQDILDRNKYVDMTFFVILAVYGYGLKHLTFYDTLVQTNIACHQGES